MLRIYNSLSRQKEIFNPIKPQQVSLYVCGITVYDYCHIGHARMLVVFDMITRYFRASGYAVTYVRNITDIDDKIIARATANKEAIDDLTRRFTEAMREDEAALNITAPDIEPKATDSVPAMIAHITELIDLGYAYVAPTGDVLYAIEQFADYGKLSNQRLQELQAGQRIAVDDNKRNPLDFVLWKATKPGEPAWDSPWGKGRPGWHIECSVMSRQQLGDRFDIHGGGLDLKFPHHECEIAQSEPVCGGKHVNYWLHNGFVQVNDEKMSKSLGNFFTIRDVLQKYAGETIRFFVISSHYRSPLNYSDAGLQEAQQSLSRLYTALRSIDVQAVSMTCLRDGYSGFFAAMDDDFNSAKALSELFALAKALNSADNDADKKQLASDLKALGAILGLLQDSPESFLQGAKGKDEVSDVIESLIAQRNIARQQKDFVLADSIRDRLHTMGIEIEDTGSKTTWRKARLT